MCGIFGMISKKPKPLNKRAFCTMGARNDSRGGDSCGVFIDGQVEYGVDKEKLFISFFRGSKVLNQVTDCKVALGHCRKASVGKVSLETAQPVVLYNDSGAVDYVLIHNGTIHNYKELAKKYIPEINIDGLTDSQVMARIFYHKGYDALDEYMGGAVFVIHDYRIDKTLVFKGSSKKYSTSKETEEERPLFYCWHNGRFVFSSIYETLYSFYYEETVYILPSNSLLTIKNGKLKIVETYSRENCCQSKPVESKPVQSHIWDDEYYYGRAWSSYESESFKIQYDGFHYTDGKKQLMNGVYFVTSYGWVYPNKKKTESWLHEVSFFAGKLLKHPKAYALINKMFQEANQQFTKEIEILLQLLEFNPFTDDLVQYYWYDEDVCMIPQGVWKIPMADYSMTFDDTGVITNIGKDSYYGWTTDYKMYTFDEGKIMEILKRICQEELSS